MNDVQDAVRYIRTLSAHQPKIALILGSGLSDLAELVSNACIIETSTIPGYPHSTVEGHVGRLVLGSIHGKHVAFVQGRLHVYEGHSVHEATFPVRLLAALGVNQLIITNAAGGINSSFKPGILMWITNHINWTRRNPLIGDQSEVGLHARKAFTPSPYDADWTHQAAAIADRLGIPTSTGTYIWTLGPNYESKAEVRAFRMLGADAVGMSTVPEVIQARALGIKVLGLSTITNFAAGLSDDHLNHQEVLAVGRQVRADLERLVLALIAQ